MNIEGLAQQVCQYREVLCISFIHGIYKSLCQDLRAKLESTGEDYGRVVGRDSSVVPREGREKEVFPPCSGD